MAYLYDIFYADGSMDPDSLLPDYPEELDTYATCTNWDGHRMVAVRNYAGAAERERIMRSLRARAGGLKRRLGAVPEVDDGSFGALMRHVGISSKQYRDAYRAMHQVASAWLVRAWVDAGCPDVPPEFVWQEQRASR